MTLFAGRPRAPVCGSTGTGGGPGAAYLVEEGLRRAGPGAPASPGSGRRRGHPAGCACCTSALRRRAAALGPACFQDRARGPRGVRLRSSCSRGPGGREAAREAAVAADPLCRAYFRLGWTRTDHGCPCGMKLFPAEAPQRPILLRCSKAEGRPR